MEGAVPNFDLGNHLELFDLHEMTDGELLETVLNMSLSGDGNASSNENPNLEMKRAMEIQQPQIRSGPTECKAKRFRVATEQDIINFQSSRQSKSTKKNTRWGYKTFQGRPRFTYSSVNS